MMRCAYNGSSTILKIIGPGTLVTGLERAPYIYMSLRAYFKEQKLSITTEKKII